MRRLILGTAGHIDHGKTALVKALTGVDTDRLKEERERGITVDLGFAEYQPQDGVCFGVVDVPGHEGFIKNMLAGATGMDLVLLVVAADESVMPQTREHFSIIRLLGVPRLAVAVTKADLVEAEWIGLVRDDIRDLLAGTAYAEAPVISVSSITGEGLRELGETLAAQGLLAEEKGSDDVVRLPIDRVFTIRGTGTVVTGTLWSGRLQEGSKVAVLPGDRDARVRSIQVHGQEVPEARAGARVAVGLSGSKVGHHEIYRGQNVVEGDGWEVSWMLTCRLTLLEDTGWDLEQGQRVRVHLGTAEVLARVALFNQDRLPAGDEGWAQLRLEEPVLARARDHLVIRSYSPVTTIGGGHVAEVLPRKRRRASPGELKLLQGRLDRSIAEALSALLEMCEWEGATTLCLPQRTGFPPADLQHSIDDLRSTQAVVKVDDRLFSGRIWREGEARIISSLTKYHQENPLKSGTPLEELRQVIPGSSGQRVGEALLQELASQGTLFIRKGAAALAGFQPTLSESQESLRSRIKEALSNASLAPPSSKELGEELGVGTEIESILRLMEDRGETLCLDGGFFFDPEVITRAGDSVVTTLGGKTDLGPAAFREVIPVTRKHLLPILRYFDLVGVTTRMGDSRSVAERLPEGWGTPERPRK